VLTLLENADIYAPEPLGVGFLLVGGGTLLYLGPERPVLDAHVHPTGGGGEDGFSTQAPPVPPSRYSRYGVTTVAGLLSRKAGVMHLHLGDGDRGLALVRRLLRETELPPRVFHPTHVNRRRELFEEACQLSREKVVINVTACPVEEGENAWSAADAWERFHDQGCAGAAWAPCCPA
jgi:hypothetical protein